MVEMFEVAPDRVISGFWFYYGINAIENGILGFQAYVELIDIMAGSFSEL
jgi:hypothetical protein